MMPNIDAMNDDEVEAALQRCRARAKIGHIRGMVIAYLSCMQTARRARLAGKIAEAGRYEDQMDVLYRKMPARGRW